MDVPVAALSGKPFTLRVVEYGSPDYRQMVALRAKVLRAPMGRILLPKELARDAGFIQLAAFDAAGQAIATALLDLSAGHTVRIRQVSVHPDWRGKGMGKAIMAFAEEQAAAAGAALASLHARETAVAFYARIGYVAEGEFFEESGLPHITMTKPLA